LVQVHRAKFNAQLNVHELSRKHNVAPPSIKRFFFFFFYNILISYYGLPFRFSMETRVSCVIKYETRLNFITGRNRQAKSVPGLSAEDWPVETRKAGIDSAAN